MKLTIALVCAALLLAAADESPTQEASQVRARALRPEAATAFKKEAKVAVIAAVGRYDALTPLQYTIADAQDLAAELRRHGYDVHLLINNEATNDNIRRKLAQMSSLIDREQGTLLFYFSGHGFSNEKGANYLATFGATAANIANEGLPVAEVEQKLNESGARRRMIWIDACRDVPGKRSGDASPPRSFAQLSQSEGMAILYSTRAGAFAYEDPSLGHGVFTHFLLEGLRGKAAGAEGLVTFGDLAQYVMTTVYDHGRKNNWIQKPFQTGERYGDFLLAAAGPAKPEDLQRAQAAPKLSGDVLVMKRGETQAPFVVSPGADQIVLINAANMTAYAVLQKGEPLSPGAPDVYTGAAPGGETIQVTMQKTGAGILMLTGRIGKRCDSNSPCHGQQILLPGEKRPVAEKAKKASRWTRIGGEIAQSTTGGRVGEIAGDVVRGTGQAEQGLSMVPVQQFAWQPFTLGLERKN